MFMEERAYYDNNNVYPLETSNAWVSFSMAVLLEEIETSYKAWKKNIIVLTNQSMSTVLGIFPDCFFGFVKQFNGFYFNIWFVSWH